MQRAEEIGSDIYREARLDQDDPPERGAIEVADRLGLKIYEQPGAKLEASLSAWDGRRRIVLRGGLTTERAHFLVAIQVARAWVGASESALCGQVGAWLVAPTAVFRRHFEHVGLDLATLASPFAITRTAAALRASEVVGLDLVVVGQSKIHRRSRGLLGKLSDEDLRTLAGKRTTRSVRKVSLREDGKAVALLAG